MIKTLAGSIREFRKESLKAPFYVSLEVLMETLIPYIMAQMIDSMTGGALGPIIKFGIMLSVMALLSLMFGILAAVAAAKASTGFAKNLRHDIYYRIQDFDFRDIDRFSTSSLITRMTTDVTNVQNAYQFLVRTVIRTPLIIIFSVIMSFRLNSQMALVFLVMIPVVGILLFLIARTAFPIFRRIFRKYDALNNSVQENVSGIRVVKAFVREDYEIEKFKKASEEVRSDFTMAEKIVALNQPVMMFCIYASMLLISYFGARIIIFSGATQMTTGDLSSLVNYSVQILGAMMMLSMVVVMLSLSQESGERIAEVLNNTSDLKSPENGITDVKDGSIEFEKVKFKYDPHSKHNTLKNINLKIESGMSVGIIGGTGSSKSTLVQLIPRLYDVTSGSVKVAGIDVREYDLEVLREAVSMVLQKNVLFSGTIKENQRWGNENATDEEIINACKIAQADEFIEQFPDGYDTKIERGGTNVSGGQKQRLCIARAILKKPKILIMDDSTSAVDTRTDALIQRGMMKELQDTTKIVIAQRTSSVEKADLIIVMDNGKIAEMGTHDELMEHGGIYAEIYETQNRDREVA